MKRNNQDIFHKAGSTRREFMRMLSAGAAGTLAAGALFGLPSIAHAQAKANILQVVTYANPSTLDPSTGRSGVDHTVLWAIFDTLINFTPELDPEPGLASSWNWEDEKTLVLNLREGVVFHDGTAFDAEAVRKNFEWGTSGPRSTINADWGSVESVEARDPHTAVLHLNQPDAALVMVLSDRAGMMSSPKALEEYGEAYDRNPVGTGQMKFVRWDDGSAVITERNDNYWDADSVKLDAIHFAVITDTNTGLRSVLSGQQNFMFRVPPAQVSNIKDRPDLVTQALPQLYYQNVYFNLSKGRGPMEDVRVRQAINFAIDKDAYNKIVTSGLGEIAQTQFPRSTAAFDEEAASFYSYDPDRARALLKEAGFGNGLKLVSNHYSDPQAAQRMEIISAMLSAVGITLDNVTGSIAQSNQTWNEGLGDIHLSAWTGRPDPAMTFSLLFHPTAYFNKGGAEPSKELTAAIDAMRSTLDPEERMAVIRRASRLEREWAMALPLVFEPQIVTMSAKVKGWTPNVLGKPRFDGVWIDS